jgi:PAS domain S-box-containing protein
MDALKVSETRYRRLFESALDGIILLNAKTAQIDDVNPFLIKMLGYTYEEFLNKKIWEIGAFVDTHLNIDAFIELQNKHYIRYDNLPLICKDGTRLWVEFVSNVYDCAGVDVIQCNIRDNTKRHLAEIAVRVSTRALKMLSDGNKALLESSTETILLYEYCKIAVDTGGYKLALMSFIDEKTQKNTQILSRLDQEDILNKIETTNLENMEKGDNPISRALDTGLVQFIEDLSNYTEMLPWCSLALGFGFKSVISVPFSLPNKTKACLSLFHPVNVLWSAPEIELLQEMTADLSFGITALRTALDNTKYQNKLRKSLEQTIQVIAAIVEERDAYTAGHERRVASICSKIAFEMGLSEDQIYGLHLAASIHDLGKIAIPSEILVKPRSLTVAEFALIKEHPMVGYNIIKDIKFPWNISQIILQHHEKINGSGYPNAIKADEILLESKILAVADIVEAMASHRPYRPALGLDAALGEIKKQRGITLDANVVDACLRVFIEDGYKIED